METAWKIAAQSSNLATFTVIGKKVLEPRCQVNVNIQKWPQLDPSLFPGGMIEMPALLGLVTWHTSCLIFTWEGEAESMTVNFCTLSFLSYAYCLLRFFSCITVFSIRLCCLSCRHLLTKANHLDISVLVSYLENILRSHFTCIHKCMHATEMQTLLSPGSTAYCTYFFLQAPPLQASLPMHIFTKIY